MYLIPTNDVHILVDVPHNTIKTTRVLSRYYFDLCIIIILILNLSYVYITSFP